MMMNWKEFGMKWSWPYFKVQSQHSPGGTEENHKNLRISGRRGRDSKSGPPEK
jgi:hypothetical protein